MGLAWLAVLAGAHEPIGPALYRFEDVVGQAVDELLCPFLGLFAGAFHGDVASSKINYNIVRTTLRTNTAYVVVLFSCSVSA